MEQPCGVAALLRYRPPLPTARILLLVWQSCQACGGMPAVLGLSVAVLFLVELSPLIFELCASCGSKMWHCSCNSIQS